MKKCSFQDNEIPISKLIHSTLIYIEKHYLTIPSNSKISYVSKMIIIQNFFIAKNCLMKLYAIIIWQRKTSQYLTNNVINKTNVKQILENENILKEFTKTMIKIKETDTFNILNYSNNQISKASFNNYSLFPFCGAKDKNLHNFTDINQAKMNTCAILNTETTTNDSDSDESSPYTHYYNFSLSLSLFLPTHKNIKITHMSNHSLTKEGHIFKKNYYLIFDPQIGMISTSIGKSHQPHISRIKIRWPQSVPPPTNQVIQRYLSLISTSRDSSYKFINTTHTLIERIYIVGQYLLTIQNLNHYSSDLHYTFTMPNPRTAVVSFSGFFLPISAVKVELLHDRIALASLSPLTPLPPRARDRCDFALHESFSNTILQLVQPGAAQQDASAHATSAPRRHISLSFSDAREVDLRASLLACRGAVFFTHVAYAWRLVIRALKKVGRFPMRATLECAGRSITQAAIRVSMFDFCTVEFALDASSGSLCVLSARPEYVARASGCRYGVRVELRVKCVARFLTEVWNTVRIGVSFGFFFGRHAYTLMPRVTCLSEIGVGFTFAPDYVFAASFSAGSFQFVVVSRRSGAIESSKTLSSVNYFRLRAMSLAELTRALTANKNLILFLQVEEELRARGFLTARKNNELKIAMMPILTVTLKVKNSGYWSMRFNKSTYPFFSRNMIAVTGRVFSLRMAALTVRLLADVQAFASVVFQSASANKFSVDVPHFTVTHELAACVRAGGCTFAADFGPFADYFSEANGVTSYTTYPGIRARATFHTTADASHVADFAEFIGGQSPISAFGAFLGQKLAALIAFVRAFSGGGWTVSRVSGGSPFFAVYGSALTLNASLTADASFTLTAPLAGSSSFLVLPLIASLPVAFTVVDDGPNGTTSNAQRATQRASFASCRASPIDVARVRKKADEFAPFYDSMSRSGMQHFFFSRSALFAVRLSCGGGAFDVKIKLTQAAFVIDALDVPAVKSITSAFSRIGGVSFAARRSLFCTTMEMIALETSVANKAAAVLDAIMQARCVSAETLALESRVTPSIVFALLEDGQQCSLHSVSGDEFTVSCPALFGKSRVVRADWLIHTIQIAAQSGARLIPSFFI